MGYQVQLEWQFLLLTSEALALTGLMFALYYIRHQFGFTPLALVLGALQTLHTYAASSDYIGQIPEQIVSPMSAILFSATLCSLLLVYVHDGALYARRLLIGLLIASIVGALIGLTLALHILLSSNDAAATIAASALIQNPGILALNLGLLYFDSLAMILIYTGLSLLRIVPIWLRLVLTLGFTASLDGLFFSQLLRFVQEPWMVMYLADATVDWALAAFFGTAIWVYINWVEITPYLKAKRFNLHNLFAVFGYRDRLLQLSLQANVDSVTAAGNRHALDEEGPEFVSDAVAQNENLSLLMIDLDYFKSVNDQHGHQAGDEILAAVAKALKCNVRHNDRLYRFGGEEFVLLLPVTDSDQATQLAQQLRKAVAQIRLPYHGQILQIRCTIGVASAPQDGKILADVLRAADERLYAGKRKGRNRVIDQKAELQTIFGDADEANDQVAAKKFRAAS